MKKHAPLLIGLVFAALLTFEGIQAGIIPAIIPAAAPTANKRGASNIFALAKSTTPASAGSLYCDDGTGLVTTAGCSTAGGGIGNVTPVTAAANTTSAQTLQEVSVTAGFYNSAAQVSAIFGSGIYSIAGGITPTLTWKVQLCTVSGCGSGTVVALATFTTTATTASSTNYPWNINLTSVGTHTTGATGNLIVHGFLSIDLGATALTAETVFNDANTTNSSNIDLTAALFIDFTVAASSGSASNSFTQQYAATFVPGGGGGGGGGATYTQPYINSSGSLFGPVFAVTAPPAIGTLTFVNQGGATATSVNGAILFAAPTSAGDSLRFLHTAAYPGTPFTFTVGFLTEALSVNFYQMGIGVSDGTKFETFGTIFDTVDVGALGWGVVHAGWSDANTCCSPFASQLGFGNQAPIYLTLTDDGVNYTFWASSNPTDLKRVQIYQGSRTSVLTATQIGIFMDVHNSSFPASVLFFHWTGI